MIVVPRLGNEDFNPVLVDSESKVVGFQRGFVSPEIEPENMDKLVYTGVQLIEPEVLELIPEGVSDTVRDIYPDLIPAGRISAFVSDRYRCECSTPERYLFKSMEVLRKKRLDRISESDLRGNCTHVICGKKVKCQESTTISKSILWDDINIGKNCSISNSILVGGPISVPDGFTVENSVVTPLIPEKKFDGVQNFKEHSLMVWPLRQYQMF